MCQASDTLTVEEALGRFGLWVSGVGFAFERDQAGDLVLTPLWVSRSAPVSLGAALVAATRQSATETVAWYQEDLQHSIRQLVDNTGTVVGSLSYDAFGKTTASSGAIDRYQNTGREWDSVLGLRYNRARLYDPATGLWLSADPSGFAAGEPPAEWVYAKQARYDVQLAEQKTIRLFHAYRDTLFVSIEPDYLRSWYFPNPKNPKEGLPKLPDRQLRTGKLPAEFTQHFTTYSSADRARGHELGRRHGGPDDHLRAGAASRLAGSPSPRRDCRAPIGGRSS